MAARQAGWGAHKPGICVPGGGMKGEGEGQEDSTLGTDPMQGLITGT